MPSVPPSKYRRKVTQAMLEGLRQAAGRDGAAAVRLGDDALAPEELLHAASAVAGGIAGAPAVAVHATPTMDTVIAVVAGLLANVPVVPVPPDAGPMERGHILRDSAPALMLAAKGALEDPGVPGVPVVPVDDVAGAETSFPGPEPGSTALVLYTSGTTGRPKGVRISHGAITANLGALAEAWAWTEEDTLVHGLPLFHVHGLILGVLGAFHTGSALVHTGRPSPRAYAGAPGTVYFGVPTVWSRVCDDPESARALRGARLLVSGSAPLRQALFENVRALTGHALVNRYGMTETLITVSGRAGEDQTPGWVGAALPGVETRLVAEDGALLPHDGSALGELEVRGPSLFTEYTNAPEATAASTTADGWFRTGDLAIVGPGGAHRIMGRASTDFIKTGGFKVSAAEVEDALLAHPAVREAAVVGAPDDDLGEQIHAYVVADAVAADELVSFVATELSVHKRPRQVNFVPELPKNRLGKVVKGELGRR